jgi:hypothetical protein
LKGLVQEPHNSKICSFLKTQKKILLLQTNIPTRTAQLTIMGKMNVGYSTAGVQQQHNFTTEHVHTHTTCPTDGRTAHCIMKEHRNTHCVNL